MKLFRRQKMDNRIGFTLVELMVVLVIISILAAIAIPAGSNFIRVAQFRKTEENAKTAYLGAETMLTYYRNNGLWDEFRDEVLRDGTLNASFTDDRQDRIYAITCKPGDRAANPNNLVYRLLDNLAYDQSYMEAAIALEIDIESGRTYSAFYSTACKELNYAPADGDDSCTMLIRDYDSRKERSLGYYSANEADGIPVDGLVNVVELRPTRLRVNSLTFVNGEKLYLQWASNSKHGSMDVEYEVHFFESKEGEEDQELFALKVNPGEIIAAQGDVNVVANLPVLLPGVTINPGEENDYTYAFPLTKNANQLTLTLDAMMSGDIIKAISEQNPAGKKALQRTTGTNITRLTDLADRYATIGDLAEPIDIYAKISVSPTYQNMEGDVNEYRASGSRASNTVNSMYGNGSKADGSGVYKAKVTNFRHLSNIRYFDRTKRADFVLQKAIDWVTTETGYYAVGAGRNVGGLEWKDNRTGILDFPSIPKLEKNHEFSAANINATVNNLILGANSVTDNGLYLGLFGETFGKVENLTLRNPRLTIGEKTNPVKLYGVGILAGYGCGELRNIKIATTRADAKVVEAYLDCTSITRGRVGIGGLLGVYSNASMLADESAEEVAAVATLIARDLEVSGTVTGSLHEKAILDPNEETATVSFGIGGIFGYAKQPAGKQLVDCDNHASVNGNGYVGGLVGWLEGEYTDSAMPANVEGCNNDGLILCVADDTNADDENHYFGGLVGYGNKVLINNCYSAAGKNRNYKYSVENRDQLLGDYVGGIMGYGHQSLLKACTTGQGGYVLGNTHVGGIVGGLHGSLTKVANEGASITTNASYVIGVDYVGGIVGENISDAVNNCVNNSVVAGYGKYIGGIVGYNDNGGEIKNCTSYIADFNNAIFNMVINTWQATGDYVGGLVGYNNARITFDDTAEHIMVKSVAGIVVGNDYIGGVAGFNDMKGDVSLAYSLIGGKVYGYGDCVGGLFGLNASRLIFTKVDNPENAEGTAQSKNLVLRPATVQGRNFVGGCIGANLIEMDGNYVSTGLRTDNALGVITGENFCGGVIGYHADLKNCVTNARATGLKAYLEAQPGGLNSILPVIDDATKEPKLVSGNVGSEGMGNYVFGIRSGNNRWTNYYGGNIDLSMITNNCTIYADRYAGGVVGYIAPGSRAFVGYCVNTGNVNVNHSGVTGVNLDAYLRDYLAGRGREQGVTDEAVINFFGGIISVNHENQRIACCENQGNLNEAFGTGGIAGLNGYQLSASRNVSNIGSLNMDYIGSIAGVNDGTIDYCMSDVTKYVSGHHYVGGIAGLNLNGASVASWDRVDGNYVGGPLSVNASGGYAGGVVGRNCGNVSLVSTANTVPEVIAITGDSGIGGMVGVNEKNGTITYENNTTIGRNISVSGKTAVGGLVGINRGNINTGTDASPRTLTVNFTAVYASEGAVGGVIGKVEHAAAYTYHNFINQNTQITTDKGNVGGIMSENPENVILDNCRNRGSMRSNQGNAGGIVAVNKGDLRNCVVELQSGRENIPMNIEAIGGDAMGAICAVNDGIIRNSSPICYWAPEGSGIFLKGDANVYGGVTGLNRGEITALTSSWYNLSYMPRIDSKATDLIVGGVAGRNGDETKAGQIHGVVQGNQWYTQIQKVGVNITFAANAYSECKYLGGIAGENSDGSEISNCQYQGGYTQTSGKDIGCFGGIAGNNHGLLQNCDVQTLTVNLPGSYGATSTSTTDQKEALATHVGGIAGKNDTTGRVDFCFLALRNDQNISITVARGMVAGIVGFNKGSISNCGEKYNIDNDVTNRDYWNDLQNKTVEQLYQKTKGSAPSKTYVNWNAGAQLENMAYAAGGSVSDSRVKLIVSSNGNLGGITAYNAPSAKVDYCVTGKWFLNNKSDAIGVGTGGIIGMNESENDMQVLINGAFVGRQLGQGKSDRFAGGIIGNQNNNTKSGWSLVKCINYGMIYCKNAHYAGGIIGQWTGSGGSIKESRNYGHMQTTYAQGFAGAAAGIVAQLYHAWEDNDYNIISCGNYGNIYGREGESPWNCANDSAGILGNITSYYATREEYGQHFNVQVLDCENGNGVKIYSSSMACGIVGFMSQDNTAAPEGMSVSIGRSTANIVLRIERCRNFAAVLYGDGGGHQFGAGIFGDRYSMTGARNTYIRNCFSLNSVDNNKYRAQYFPIVFMNNDGDGSRLNELMQTDPVTYANNYYRNYFFGDTPNSNANGWQIISLPPGSLTGYPDNMSYYNTNERKMLARGGGEVLFFTWSNEGQSGAGYYGVSIKDRTTRYRSNLDSRIWNNENFFQGSGGGRVTLGEAVCSFGNMPGFPNDKNAVNMDDLMNYPVFCNATRESYRFRNIEGIVHVNNGNYDQLRAPAAVNAQIAGGILNVHVTPQNNGGVAYDPFAYEATIRMGEKEKTVTFYSEDANINLSDMTVQGDVSVEVRALSMYEDVRPSDPVSNNTPVVIGQNLPDPQIRAELVRTQNNGYRYRIVLENMDEYRAVEEEMANDPAGRYSGWKVLADYRGLSADATTAWIMLDSENSEIYVEGIGTAIQQLIVRAYPVLSQTANQGPDAVGTVLYEQSPEKSVPVYMPSYVPTLGVTNGTAGTATAVQPVVTFTGDTIEELDISVELNGTNTQAVNVAPLYRAELIGTWRHNIAPEGQPENNVTEDVVLAYTDILAVTNGSSIGTIKDLPDYVGDMTNIRIRVRYMMSGLGPVYSYADYKDDYETALAAANAGEGQLITTLEGFEEDGEPILTYSVSPVMLTAATEFNNYKYTSNALFTLLPKPELEPEMILAGENSTLTYTFKWDQNKGIAYRNAAYAVSLTGINNDNEKVIIDVGNVYTNNTAKELVISAENWHYSQVELSVTRLGGAGILGIGRNIGQKTTMVYNVRQRLTRPGQPVVRIKDNNELFYNVQWAGIDEKESCEGYDIYVIDGTSTKLTITPIPATGATVYDALVDLEQYAGRQIEVYVAAKAKADSETYTDSLAGISARVTVPLRLATPVVTWNTAWPMALDQVDFENGGMTVKVTASAGSIPPGGSAYLLKGEIYDGNGAQATLLDTYPAADEEGLITPIQMQAESTTVHSNQITGLSAKYANKWVKWYTRISSGDSKASSLWVSSTMVQLPKVRLMQPLMIDDDETQTLRVKINTNPDISGDIDPSVSGDDPMASGTIMEKDWTVNRMAYQILESEYSNRTYITLQGASVKEYRLCRLVDAENHVSFALQEKNGIDWQNVSADSADAETGVIRYVLSYQPRVAGTYQGMPYAVTIPSELEVTYDAEADQYQYLLLMPDAYYVWDDEMTPIPVIRFNVTDVVSVQTAFFDGVNEEGAYVKSELKSVIVHSAE